MTISCNDRERIFLDGSAQEWAALEEHAERCAGCRDELLAWKNLSIAASELREEWDSPALWPRIAEALQQQRPKARNSWWQRVFGDWEVGISQWQTVAAALLLCAVTGAAIWFAVNHRSGPDIAQTPALLKDGAVRDVERAQLSYERAIDKLDTQARPQLENSSSPLIANYREKLLVIDSAIADLKAQAGINPGNGHIRRQLLAIYQQKQDTLEEILEVKP